MQSRPHADLAAPRHCTRSNRQTLRVAAAKRRRGLPPERSRCCRETKAIPQSCRDRTETTTKVQLVEAPTYRQDHGLAQAHARHMQQQMKCNQTRLPTKLPNGIGRFLQIRLPSGGGGSPPPPPPPPALQPLSPTAKNRALRGNPISTAQSARQAPLRPPPPRGDAARTARCNVSCGGLYGVLKFHRQSQQPTNQKSLHSATNSRHKTALNWLAVEHQLSTIRGCPSAVGGSSSAVGS